MEFPFPDIIEDMQYVIVKFMDTATCVSFGMTNDTCRKIAHIVIRRSIYVLFFIILIVLIFFIKDPQFGVWKRSDDAIDRIKREQDKDVSSLFPCVQRTFFFISLSLSYFFVTYGH